MGEMRCLIGLAWAIVEDWKGVTFARYRVLH